MPSSFVRNNADALRRRVAAKAPRFADKFERLIDALDSSAPALVAFSGGVDSSLLAYVAAKLDGRTVCVTASSETYTRDELDHAKRFAKKHGLVHVIIKTSELENPEFASNPRDRCYHCKKEMLRALREVAAERGAKSILYGDSSSDMRGFRPGRKAVREEGARAPLAEAGLAKDDVRALSKALGLETWDRPQNACLASRIEYGMPLTAELLTRVAKAEKMLHDDGFEQVRVRVHGEIARIELGGLDEISAKGIRETAKRIKALGFKHVTLDLEGYRSGSMND